MSLPISIKSFQLLSEGYPFISFCVSYSFMCTSEYLLSSACMSNGKSFLMMVTLRNVAFLQKVRSKINIFSCIGQCDSLHCPLHQRVKEATQTERRSFMYKQSQLILGMTKPFTCTANRILHSGLGFLYMFCVAGSFLVSQIYFVHIQYMPLAAFVLLFNKMGSRGKRKGKYNDSK